MSEVASDESRLRIAVNSAANAAATIDIPVLGNHGLECVFRNASPAGASGAFSCFEEGPWLLGCATADPSLELEDAARRLYDDLLVATRGRHLCRIWNYVPAINGTGIGGLENYRLFCRGRSLAFEAALGPDFKRHVPAASAVGADSGGLAVVFAASDLPARHIENPSQVPAYDYPSEHGPRSPSFARATVVPEPDGTRAVFISGTAAIRGHASIASANLGDQLACTLENLQCIGRACGLGADLAAGRCASRHFKVYLRHAADQRTAAALSAGCFGPADSVIYLRSDICRRELVVEIDVTLRGVAPA